MTLLEGFVLKIIVIAGCVIFSYFQLVTSSMEFSLTHGEAIVKNDDNYVNLDHVRVKKVNRTHHLIIGNLTLFINQGNEYQFYGLLYKKQGNEYKKTPYKMGPKKFCDFLSGEKLFYPSIHATSDFPSIGTCPWPKNLYHLFGYSVQFNVLPPTLSSGDYMVECYSELAGKLQNGYRFYGTVANSINM